MFGRSASASVVESKNRELEESKETVTCAICMEYYDDARLLTCSHTFCLGCLIKFQSDKNGQGFCPTCRKNSVPPLSQLHSLPSNTFANGLAELIRTQENPPPPAVTGGPTGESANGSQNEEAMFVGQIIEEPVQPKRPVIKPWQAALAVAACAVTGGLGGFVAGAAVAGLGLYSGKIKDKIAKREKEMYSCCSCADKIYDLHRYRCGMCRDDFTICPRCFRNRSIVQQHNPNHIFILLPQKPKRFLPDMPLLKPLARELSDSFVFTRQGMGDVKHGKAYVHTPDKLIKLDGIQCKSCLIKPITGHRYKCGHCSDYDLCSRCYVNRGTHDPEHVFLVLTQYCEINISKEPLICAKFF